MCDFNTLTDEEKKLHHQNILEYANRFGGKNFFLQLLEAIRATKPHPLVDKSNEFHMELGNIKWNKTIFNEKLQLLIKARIHETKQDNFLPNKDEKNYKKILNIIRTLKPIVFHIRPLDKQNGSGFFFQAFEQIDENRTKLNPIFDTIFFCSIDSVKKALNYTSKA